MHIFLDRLMEYLKDHLMVHPMDLPMDLLMDHSTDTNINHMGTGISNPLTLLTMAL